VQDSQEEVETVYKFRSPSLFALRNLEKGQLRFTKPSEFNDPFDCLIVTNTDGEKEDWIAWVNKKNLPEMQKKVILNELKKINYDGSKYSGLKGQTDVVYVLSLTVRNDSVLMWSHYALNHTGFALGFQTEKVGTSLGMRFHRDDCTDVINRVSDGFIPISDVLYTENTPRPFNTLKDDPKRLHDFTLRKHPDWSYEHERRVVVSKSMVNTQNIRFQKDMLKEIIYGYKTEKDMIDMIEIILKSRYPSSGKDIKRKIAKPIQSKYAVEIVEM